MNTMNQMLPDRSSLSDFAGSLRSSIERNPISAALIGAGALLLLFGAKRSRQGLGDAAHAARDGARDAGQALADSTSSLAETAQETWQETRQEAWQNTRPGTLQDNWETTVQATSERLASARKRATSLLRGTQDQSQALFEQLRDLFERQPLALGVIGVAIGSAVAASLPTTRLETETLGPTSDALKRSMAERFGTTDEIAKSATDAAYEAVKEEAAKQGLTADRLKSELEDRVAGLSRAFLETERSS